MCGRHVYKPNAGLQSTQVEFKVYHFSFIAELLRNWTRGHRQRRRPSSGLKGQTSADDMGSCGSAGHLGDVVGCTSAASSRGPEWNLNLTAFLSFYNFGSQKTNFHSLLLFILKLLSYQKCLLKKLEYDYNTKKKLKIPDLTWLFFCGHIYMSNKNITWPSTCLTLVYCMHHSKWTCVICLHWFPWYNTITFPVPQYQLVCCGLTMQLRKLSLWANFIMMFTMGPIKYGVGFWREKTLWLCALDLINSVFVGGYLD